MIAVIKVGTDYWCLVQLLLKSIKFLVHMSKNDCKSKRKKIVEFFFVVTGFVLQQYFLWSFI